MDEQSSMNVTVYATDKKGVLKDLTGASITWVASFNGVQQVKKDIATMTIMLAPAATASLTSEAAAGADTIDLDKVASFGRDAWGRPIADFAAGDFITVTDGTNSDLMTIESIDLSGFSLTFTSGLGSTYQAAATATEIIPSFSFSLLVGDTILPATKSYGTAIIWQHMALASWPAAMSPGNIYQAATDMVAIRGRMFIMPILDMS
jgi:hypothetical protein